ncbi:unnamed protein product [Diamesa serratosioi]
MRVKHINRTERLWAGNMTYFVDVGNEVTLETIIYKRSGRTYQQTPFKFPSEKFCDRMKTSPNYEDLRKVSNIPASDVCPWPKGTYEVYGYNLNIDRLPPYFVGHYMFETRFYKDGDFLNGYRLYGTIIET